MKGVGDRFELPVGRLPVGLRRCESGPVRRELDGIRGTGLLQGFQFRLPLCPVALQGVEIHGEQALVLSVFRRRPFAFRLCPRLSGGDLRHDRLVTASGRRVQPFGGGRSRVAGFLESSAQGFTESFEHPLFGLLGVLRVGFHGPEER